MAKERRRPFLPPLVGGKAPSICSSMSYLAAGVSSTRSGSRTAAPRAFAREQIDSFTAATAATVRLRPSAPRKKKSPSLSSPTGSDWSLPRASVENDDCLTAQLHQQRSTTTTPSSSSSSSTSVERVNSCEDSPSSTSSSESVLRASASSSSGCSVYSKVRDSSLSPQPPRARLFFSQSSSESGEEAPRWDTSSRLSPRFSQSSSRKCRLASPAPGGAGRRRFPRRRAEKKDDEVGALARTAARHQQTRSFFAQAAGNAPSAFSLFKTEPAPPVGAAASGRKAPAQATTAAKKKVLCNLLLGSGDASNLRRRFVSDRQLHSQRSERFDDYNNHCRRTDAVRTVHVTNEAANVCAGEKKSGLKLGNHRKAVLRNTLAENTGQCPPSKFGADPLSSSYAAADNSVAAAEPLFASAAFKNRRTAAHEQKASFVQKKRGFTRGSSCHEADHSARRGRSSSHSSSNSRSSRSSSNSRSSRSSSSCCSRSSSLSRGAVSSSSSRRETEESQSSSPEGSRISSETCCCAVVDDSESRSDSSSVFSQQQGVGPPLSGENVFSEVAAVKGTVNKLQQVLAAVASDSSSSSSSASTDGAFATTTTDASSLCCSPRSSQRAASPALEELGGHAADNSFVQPPSGSADTVSSSRSVSSADGAFSWADKRAMVSAREDGSGGEDATAEKDSSSCHLMNVFPLELLHTCFHFLPVEDILKLQIVSTSFYLAIREHSAAFLYVQSLSVDDKWAKLDIYERQQMLLQMQRLQHIQVSADAFSGGTITIQEIGALVFRNAHSLRSLSINSPENPLQDVTPMHEPFAFQPVVFTRLCGLSILGCQALEWAHALSNCFFPAVERFEISYFPVSSDHWSWQVLPDFTALGVRGLQRLVDRMPTLERFTVGLDIRYENRRRETWEDPPVAGYSTGVQLDAVNEHSFDRAWRRRAADSASSGNNSSSNSSSNGAVSLRRVDLAQHSAFGAGCSADVREADGRRRMWRWPVADNEEADGEFNAVPPVGGPAQLRSWRGKISETDFADLLAAAYVRAGGAGNLKRITIKYCALVEEEEVATSNVSSFSEFFHGAAAFCYRYVSDIFSGFNS